MCNVRSNLFLIFNQSIRTKLLIDKHELIKLVTFDSLNRVNKLMSSFISMTCISHIVYTRPRSALKTEYSKWLWNGDEANDWVIECLTWTRLEQLNKDFNAFEQCLFPYRFYSWPIIHILLCHLMKSSCLIGWMLLVRHFRFPFFEFAVVGSFFFLKNISRVSTNFNTNFQTRK